MLLGCLLVHDDRVLRLLLMEVYLVRIFGFQIVNFLLELVLLLFDLSPDYTVAVVDVDHAAHCDDWGTNR